MSDLLNNVLDDIVGLRELSGLCVVEFHLLSPFAVVRLSDDSIGSAGNYDVQNMTPGYDAEAVAVLYQRAIENDPLLLNTLRDDQSLAGLSLRTAVLSALSQPLMNNQSLRPFGLVCMPVADRTT